MYIETWPSGCKYLKKYSIYNYICQCFGSGSNRVCGSGSRKHVFEMLDVLLGGAGGFSCSVTALHGGLSKTTWIWIRNRNCEKSLEPLPALKLFSIKFWPNSNRFRYHWTSRARTCLYWHPPAVRQLFLASNRQNLHLNTLTTGTLRVLYGLLH